MIDDSKEYVIFNILSFLGQKPQRYYMKDCKLSKGFFSAQNTTRYLDLATLFSMEEVSEITRITGFGYHYLHINEAIVLDVMET